MDALAYNILLQLVRNGTLGLDDCTEIADRLTAEGEHDAAHAAKAAFFEASMPTPGEAQRDQIRRSLRVIDSGGNAPEG